MTRIRKNWSSSRGAEDPESLPSHVVVNHDSQMVDTEGKPPSPILLQLVNEDAMHMLAAVSLESLEHDSGIRNLKCENSSAKVMAAMSMDSLEHEDGRHNLKHETISPKIWDQPFLQNVGLLSQRTKSDHWYQKLSAVWQSDRGVSLTNTSTRKETVDEEQSKSSSVADNEMGDSDLSARVERAKQGLVAAEPMKGLISGLLQVHCLEREPTNAENSRVLQDLVLARAAAGRKKRQKPWECELNLPVTPDGYKTDQKTQKLVNKEGLAAGDSNKRRVKSLKVPQDQGTCDRGTVRADCEKVVKDDGDGTKLWTDTEKLGTNDGDRNQLKAKPEKVGNEVEDMDQLNATVEKVGNDFEDRKKQRAKSQDVGTDGDKNRLRVKPSKLENGAQKIVAEAIFPTGWKYKGLAQIAEKDEAANGQVKKLCGRTDGHNWRCPLRVVEGLSLCQHHLNKARAKKLGKTNHQRKQLQKTKPDEASVSPHTSDSLTFKSSMPCDQQVPTKFRRRHKTAKLSVL